MKNKKRGKSKSKVIRKSHVHQALRPIRKRKYWLLFGKIGAIVGLMICLISMLILLSYNSNCGNADNCMIDAPNHIKIAYNIFSVFSWPIIEFIKQGKMSEMTYIILGVLILIVEYFIAGAVIGGIVDIVKMARR